MNHLWCSKCHKVSELSSQKTLDCIDKSYGANFSKQTDWLTFFFNQNFWPLFWKSDFGFRFSDCAKALVLIYLAKNHRTSKYSTEQSFWYFLSRPKYVLHDMQNYCLLKLYASKRHRKAHFVTNSKFWKISFCACWVQIRVCKLRQPEFNISDATYFGLVKKYLKLLSVEYFKVRPYSRKLH